MSEGLLAPSGVKLYGREFAELKLSPKKSEDAAAGDNNFLSKQIHAKGARLARIYGFSYEGHYYDLPKPAIFLVHGDGKDAEAGNPVEVDRTGVAARDWYIEKKVRVWDYDKGDFSLRLDIETGPFEQILLQAALRPDKMQGYYSGADMRVSGADMRVSGADMRVSGADMRLRRNRD